MSMFLLFINYLATVIWSFADLFVILVTTGLTERYVWLNKRVKYLSRRKYQDIPWNRLRKNYAILSDLVKQTNNNISALIFISYIANVCFTLIGLFREIATHRTGQYEKIYTFVSYCYIIGKIIAIALSASKINIESKEALPHIYLCKSSKFTDEAKRLQYQLTYDDIVFTGMNFFSITRNFILAVSFQILFNLNYQYQEL
ncbi:hypothetical protein HCN44_006333 [Aphidius gifuensis]|uniref:Gustatory receptor n=1 Tax=Aphidius gifuensis TaxID=684658 RepID=A0A835CTG9_APHGI|nr:hypothetical protein HCN44_006333 [Aphidius gifuensis]